MGLLNKMGLTSAFIGTATAAQAALSLVTVDFEVVENAGFPGIPLGETGNIQFVIDDSVTSVFNSSRYEFDGAVTELSGNIGSLTFSDDNAFGDLVTFDDLNISGDLTDGYNFTSRNDYTTSNPDLTVTTTVLELADSDENLWSDATTIAGTVNQHTVGLASNGRPENRVVWEFHHSGFGVDFDVVADITGASVSPIPEPSSYGAVAGALALAGAAASRRRHGPNLG